MSNAYSRLLELGVSAKSLDKHEDIWRGVATLDQLLAYLTAPERTEWEIRIAAHGTPGHKVEFYSRMRDGGMKDALMLDRERPDFALNPQSPLLERFSKAFDTTSSDALF